MPAARVKQLGQKRSMGTPWAAVAARAATLRDGARRRARFKPCCKLCVRAKGAGGSCVARATIVGFVGGPNEAAASPPWRTAGLRSSGTPVNGVPVAARATAYLTWRKRAREGHWFLLRVQLGRRRSAASTAMLAGGEVGAVFAGGSQVCDFGLPGPADWLERSLR